MTRTEDSELQFPTVAVKLHDTTFYCSYWGNKDHKWVFADRSDRRC